MTGDDVVEGQALIDELCWRFGQATNNAEGQPSDPFASERDDREEETPTHSDVADALRESVAYDGDNPKDWDLPEGESVEYHAVLRARERSDELLNTANWELIGYAAALGKHDGLSKENVLADLEAHPTPQYGYEPTRAEKEVRGIWRKTENGNYHPPSVSTLKRRGILPDDYVSIGELHTDDTLSGKQKWEAWSDARERGELTENSKVPTEALQYIAEKEGFYDFSKLPAEVDSLPVKAHNKALWWVENVWWDPKDEKDTDATTCDFEERDPDDVHTWEDVRYVYDAEKGKGRKAAETVLRDRYHFMSVPEFEDSLHVYKPDSGTYSTNLGGVRSEIHTGLDEKWSRKEKNEILSRLEQQNIIQPTDLNGRDAFDTPHICVDNGVLDLFERELKPHSPEYYYLDRVPVTYDENASVEPYEEFIEDVTHEDRPKDAKAMIEMVGHALTPDAHERGWKKFMILYGGADNGKSFFYDRVTDLLNGANGEAGNVMSVKLQKMSQNRFSKDAMYGHMANIAGEVNGKKITNTADIKDITGGDRMEIEPKGGESFADTMNTTLMFAANDPPIIGSRDKEAIATRIVPIELPHKFVENPTEPHHKQKRPESELEDELTTQEALSGFLNLALDGIQRLKQNKGDVSLSESPMQRLKQYEGSADPMKEFAEECLTDDPNDLLVKADVTTIFKEYAEANDYELGSNVHGTLHEVLDYSDSYPRPPYYECASIPLREWDDRKKVIDRVTLTEKGLEYAESAGLVVDDEGEDDDTESIVNLDVGMHTEPVTATVAEKIDPPDWLEGKGHLVDGEGGLMPYVIESNDVFAGIDESDSVTLQNFKVENRDGVKVAVFSGITRVRNHAGEQNDLPDTQDQLSETATDGGELENVNQRVAKYVRENYDKGDTLSAGAVAGSIDDLSPDDVETALETIQKEKRLLSGTGDGWEVLE